VLSLLYALTLSGVLWGPAVPAAPPAPQPLRLEVELEPRAEVGGAILRLRDLAHVQSGSLWAGLPLGASPAPGATRIVTRAEVRTALQAQGFALKITGAERVRVSRRALARPTGAQVLLSGRFVERIAARFVRRELKLDPKAPLTLRSQLPLRWGVPRSAGSRLHARWAAQPQGDSLLRVVVEVRSGQRAVASLALNFERPTPETASPQPSQRRERSSRATSPSTQKPAPRKVRPRQVRPRQVEREDAGVELVKRGSHVTLIVKSGSLTITSEGVAEKGGARGESVPVRIAKDRPLVVGRIVDRGRVVVELRPRESE